MATLQSPPTASTSNLSTTTTLVPQNATFTFPPRYHFPPFFSLQPNPTTRSAQFSIWSDLIQSYCRHHRLFSLSLADALPTALFTNAQISRSLSLKDAKVVIQWMTTPEGGSRAEWIGNGRKGGKGAGTGLVSSSGAGGDDEGGAGAGGASRCWIYWRRPEEWATVLEEWVERTGQKGTVVTLYELTESDATKKEDFWGMEGALLAKSLQVSVKRGKAQVFGAEGSEGVKFF